MGESPKNGSPPTRGHLRLMEGNKNRWEQNAGKVEVCAFIIPNNTSRFLALENEERGCLQLPSEHLCDERGRIDLHTCKDAIEKECIFNRLLFPSEEMEVAHSFSYLYEEKGIKCHGVAFTFRLQSQWRPHNCLGRYLSFSELTALDPGSAKLVRAYVERERAQRKLAMKVSSIGVKVAR